MSNELRREVERIGYRNNGRDDRVCGRWGLECRHPYLDRDLVDYAMRTPLDALCDLTLKERQGGKLVLRDILRDTLGFARSIWDAPKKAMQVTSVADCATPALTFLQFGSRMVIHGRTLRVSHSHAPALAESRVARQVWTP